jgi:hypothetical protein
VRLREIKGGLGWDFNGEWRKEMKCNERNNNNPLLVAPVQQQTAAAKKSQNL